MTHASFSKLKQQQQNKVLYFHIYFYKSDQLLNHKVDIKKKNQESFVIYHWYVKKKKLQHFSFEIISLPVHILQSC